jgi:hypothetical protein
VTLCLVHCELRWDMSGKFPFPDLIAFHRGGWLATMRDSGSSLQFSWLSFSEKIACLPK